MMIASRSMLQVIGILVVLLSAARAAEAGPPLICHPFDAGASPVLPWANGTGWRTPDPSYNVQGLTADTLRLLNATAPVLARMENMRRATIYVLHNARIASELLAAVLARTAQTPNDPLAWFDAGYLVESYRQAEHIGERTLLSKDVDGYQYVRKALELAGSNPEMDFAASLMKAGAIAAEHRRRAQAGAAPGSLLAKNLGKISL